MQKMLVIRSLCSICRRSSVFTASAAVSHHSHRHLHFSFPPFSYSPKTPFHELQHPSTAVIRSTRHFSEDLTRMPDIKDPEIQRALKDLLSTSWDELSNAVVGDAEYALTKNTDDKAGQEALINVFRAAEAVEEFTEILTSLKTEIDDAIGLSSEKVNPMSKEISDAFRTVYQRYNAYLSAFGPEEVYLKKKVEMELGSKMIHLKMGYSWWDLRSCCFLCRSKSICLQCLLILGKLIVFVTRSIFLIK